MKRVLLELTKELWAAIDAARGDSPRNPWLESILRKVQPIRRAAKRAKIDIPDRPDKRGRWKRKASK